MVQLHKVKAAAKELLHAFITSLPFAVILTINYVLVYIT